MFKKFNDKENISGTTQVKTSVIRSIREKLSDKYPNIKEYLDHILPKKEPIKLIKCHERIEILAVNGEAIFFKQRDDFMPTLKLLHKYPSILPQQQVDRGAIQFVLSGANIMCPGLTSPGASLVQADKDTVVAIMAEGKQHAIAIGVMKMSADDIKKVNKGIGVENIHYLLDGLWHMRGIKK